MSRLANILGPGERRLLAIEARLDEHAQRLDAQAQRLDRQRELLTQQQQRLDHQRERLRELGSQSTETARLGVAYPVLAAQMASFEARLQQLLDASVTADVTADDAERAEARHLLDEVRREHARIRVRFGVVGRYEERVRRLEAAIASASQRDAPLDEGVPPER